MVIIGANGFAKEVLEIFYELGQVEKIVFYDDINNNIGLFNKFKILKNKEEVSEYFKKNGNKFTIGIGNPILRFKLYQKFISFGGEIVSSISPNAKIGSEDVKIGLGSNVLCNSIISNSVSVGKCCIVYYNVLLTHDCTIDDFVELSPNCTLLGNVKIGKFTQIGASSTILPNINIGTNVIIGAGSVVTKDIPDNCMAFGVPAKIIKLIEPINFNSIK